MEQESLVFTITIDQDRARIMHAMINSFLLMRPITERAIKEEGLYDAMESLIAEFDDKYHTKKWCVDPTCTWTPQKNAAGK